MTSVKMQDRGFSLLEVLISVIVIAIGMLGIAALQTNAVRFNHSAELRSIAILQVNSIVDRMYANLPALKAGAYNNISGVGSNPSCTTCTFSQIAQRDIYQWNTTNATLLPNGQGTVVRNGTQFRVTVRWDNNRSGATGLGCSGNSAVDLSCMAVEVQIR